MCRHVFGKISSEFRGISRVFVNFAGFRRFTWNLRLRDRAKYQKPWIKKILNKFDIVKEKIRCNSNLYCHLIVEYNSTLNTVSIMTFLSWIRIKLTYFAVSFCWHLDVTCFLFRLFLGHYNVSSDSWKSDKYTTSPEGLVCTEPMLIC